METLPNEIVINVWTLVSIIGTAIVTGGALGIGTLGIVARSILNNEAGVKAVEALGDSVPANTANLILEVVRNTEPVIDLVEEALDGVPADSKEPAPFTDSQD